MKKEIKDYIVSSADWEFEIDDVNPHTAARSGLIFAFGRFGKDLLLSTTIMVNTKSGYINDNIENACFYSTHSLLMDLGLYKLSKGFLEFTKNIYELKNN